MHKTQQDCEDAASSCNWKAGACAKKAASFMHGHEEYDRGSFTAKMITRHNQHRRLHGAQPLTANAEIAATAERWAIVLAGDRRNRHSLPSEPKASGENHWHFKQPDSAGENIAEKNFPNQGDDKKLATEAGVRAVVDSSSQVFSNTTAYRQKKSEKKVNKK